MDSEILHGVILSRSKRMNGLEHKQMVTCIT